MASRERVEFDVVGRDSGGSRTFKQVGDAAAKAADQVEDLGEASAKAAAGVEGLGGATGKAGEKAEDAEEQYRGLKHEIAEVEGNVRRLAAEIDRTGNKDLFKDLRKQQSELRKLTRVRDLLPGDDETHEEAVRFGGRLAAGVAAGLSRAGGPITGALSKAFGTLPPQAQVAIGAGVVGAAVAAAPAIAAVVSGAVVGAAGAGGIVGGVAIAAKHPQVQAAAKLTGDTYTRELQRAAVSFVPATVESLSIVRSEARGIGDDLERAFSAGSAKLPGLTENAMAGARRAVEGFATAVERSGPVVDALGTIVERTGDVIGDTFEGLSEHSSEGAHALLVLWGVFELGIRSVAGTIEMLTVAYGWLEKFGAVLTGDTAALGRMAAEQEVAKQSGNGLSQGLQELIDGFKGTGDSAATAAVKVETLNEMVQRLAGENISAEQASIRMEEAIDRATDAGKRNNDGIDRNTAKGRENRKLLIGLAEATNTSADAIQTQTGSYDRAEAATERGRKKFLEAAKAMGVSKKEAKELADQLFGIPEKRKTDVDVKVKQTPIDLKTLAGRIAAIKSKRVVITTVNNQVTTRSEGRNVGIGDGIGGRASGGPTLRGETYWVGEDGPELLTFAASGYVLNARQSEEIARGAAARTAAPTRAAANGTGSATSGRGGGFDEARLASAIARAMSRMTLRLDDRTGNYATLLSRGDG